MNRRAITVFGLICALAAALGFFVATKRSTPNLPSVQPQSAQTSPAHDAFALTVVPKRKQEIVNGVRPGESPVAAYQSRFKCLGVTSDSQIDLRKEIDDLRAGSSRVDDTTRATYQQAIAEKEKALSDQSACLTLEHPVSSDDLHALLLAAARSGDVPSQLAFARNPQIDPLHPIAHTDDLRQWKQLATEYVNAAAAAGNADALLLQAEASDPYDCQASNSGSCAGLYGEIVGTDASRAYENYYLSMLLDPDHTPAWVSAELAALETLMSPAELQSAKKGAEDRRSTLLPAAH